MESTTLAAALAACAGAAVMLLLVVVVLLATRGRRSHADLAEALAAAQRESEDLRRRLDELTSRLEHSPDRPDAEAPLRADYVITHVGEADEDHPMTEVPDRLVLSATLGEPLVKVAAFSHGVRRALSPESRNRIWFEMRREVRASRRRRRQLRKRLEREYRANLRMAEADGMETLA
jgi:hypothetical protein